MESTMLVTSLATAFGAGLLATLSPCIYPMLPVTLGYFGMQSDSRRRARILQFSLGQWLALSLLGGVTVRLGEALGFSAEIWWIHAVVGVMCIAFVGVSVLPSSGGLTARLNALINRLTPDARRPWGPLAFGATSALIFSPCVTPLLGTALGAALVTGSGWQGFAVMSAYALGFSIILLAVGLGIAEIRRLPRSGNWLSWSHRVGMALIFGFGIWEIGKAIALL